VFNNRHVITFKTLMNKKSADMGRDRHTLPVIASATVTQSPEQLEEGHLFVAGDLSGSFKRCLLFLAGLETMKGQHQLTDDVSAVEFLLDDVAIVASMEPDGCMPYLLLAALPMPPDESSLGARCRHLQKHGTASPGANLNVVWDSAAGTYVLLRKIPIETLYNERALLDAVVEMASNASQWRAFF
jgi:hypothetical protein